MANKPLIRIINTLIENQTEDLNISKISKYSKTDYKNTYLTIEKLEKQGIVKLETFGKSKKVIFIKKTHPLIFETEIKRRENLFKQKDLFLLYKELSCLSFPFIALIFGSVVKGEKKPSDIDLLTISNADKQKKISEIVEMFPMNIHLIRITFEEFQIMLKSKEFRVVSEAIKKNIVLIGIEIYYRLLCWMKEE